MSPQTPTYISMPEIIWNMLTNCVRIRGWTNFWSGFLGSFCLLIAYLDAYYISNISFSNVYYVLNILYSDVYHIFSIAYLDVYYYIFSVLYYIYRSYSFNILLWFLLYLHYLFATSSIFYMHIVKYSKRKAFKTSTWSVS